MISLGFWPCDTSCCTCAFSSYVSAEFFRWRSFRCRPCSTLSTSKCHLPCPLWSLILKSTGHCSWKLQCQYLLQPIWLAAHFALLPPCSVRCIACFAASRDANGSPMRSQSLAPCNTTFPSCCMRVGAIAAAGVVDDRRFRSERSCVSWSFCPMMPLCSAMASIRSFVASPPPAAGTSWPVSIAGGDVSRCQTRSNTYM